MNLWPPEILNGLEVRADRVREADAYRAVRRPKRTEATPGEGIDWDAVVQDALCRLGVNDAAHCRPPD